MLLLWTSANFTPNFQGPLNYRLRTQLTSTIAWESRQAATRIPLHAKVWKWWHCATAKCVFACNSLRGHINWYCLLTIAAEKVLYGTVALVIFLLLRFFGSAIQKTIEVQYHTRMQPGKTYYTLNCMNSTDSLHTFKRCIWLSRILTSKHAQKSRSARTRYVSNPLLHTQFA